jgi:hypothetical protein
MRSRREGQIVLVSRLTRAERRALMLAGSRS